MVKKKCKYYGCTKRFYSKSLWCLETKQDLYCKHCWFEGNWMRNVPKELKKRKDLNELIRNVLSKQNMKEKKEKINYILIIFGNGEMK